MTAAHVRDVVVIGGGVAGMAATWTLRDRDVLLVEASNRLGGRLLSYPRHPYWLNLGAHLFPGAGSTVESLVNGLGLRTISIPGSTFGLVWDGTIYSRSRVELYPFSLPMSLRERLAFAVKGLKILSLVAAWRRSGRAGSTGSAPLSGRTFRSVVGRPPARVAELFEAAARRSSAELDDQSIETAGQLFAGVWAGKSSSLAFNLDGGSGRLGQEFGARMSRHVALGSEVLSVERSGTELVVSIAKEGRTTEVRCRAAVIAAPAGTAATIGAALPDEVRATLAAVPYGSFVSMAASTSGTTSTPFDEVYAVTTPGCAFDMLFNHANPVRDGSVRQQGGSLMVYAGGERARSLLDASDAQAVDTFVPDIVRLLPHQEGSIVETVVQRWPHGLPYRAPRTDLRSLHAYVEAETRLQLCGDYFRDLGNMEIAASSGVRAARRVLEGLG